MIDFVCGSTVFWGLEGSREYGGESGSGATMKGYQPGGAFYPSPWCRTMIVLENAPDTARD